MLVHFYSLYWKSDSATCLVDLKDGDMENRTPRLSASCGLHLLDKETSLLTITLPGFSYVLETKPTYCTVGYSMWASGF